MVACCSEVSHSDGAGQEQGDVPGGGGGHEQPGAVGGEEVAGQPGVEGREHRGTADGRRREQGVARAGDEAAGGEQRPAQRPGVDGHDHEPGGHGGGHAADDAEPELDEHHPTG